MMIKINCDIEIVMIILSKVIMNLLKKVLHFLFQKYQHQSGISIGHTR